jgi:hypothetical protein
MENIANPPFLISLTFSSAKVSGPSATSVQTIGTVGTQLAVRVTAHIGVAVSEAAGDSVGGDDGDPVKSWKWRAKPVLYHDVPDSTVGLGLRTDWRPVELRWNAAVQEEYYRSSAGAMALVITSSRP